MQILSLYKKRVALKEKLVQMLHYDQFAVKFRATHTIVLCNIYSKW